MAGNPAWCLSLSEWRRRFAAWVDRPEAEGLLHATIFFDFRPIGGRHPLVSELRAWLAQAHRAGCQAPATEEGGALAEVTKGGVRREGVLCYSTLLDAEAQADVPHSQGGAKHTYTKVPLFLGNICIFSFALVHHVHIRKANRSSKQRRSHIGARL